MIKEYLNHKFLIEPDAIKKVGMDKYQCMVCGCICYFDLYTMRMLCYDNNFGLYLLDLNCDEVIIKNIIE